MTRRFLAAGFVVLGGACAGPAVAQTASITNSIGMEFVLLKPGTMQVGVFKPGCPDPAKPALSEALMAALLPPGMRFPMPGPSAPQAASDKSAGNNPSTQRSVRSGFPGMPAPDPRNEWASKDRARCAAMAAHDSRSGFPVKIAAPFYIGKFEVTQAQWKAVMGNNPSTFQKDMIPDDGDRHPVENVTWKTAQEFVRRLNAREKTRAYRLPTEFEWEYACRAGGPGQQVWTDIIKQAHLGSPTGMMGSPPPIGGRSYGRTTAAVGSKAPNGWGLYDMLGNVWEWTADTYNRKHFADPRPRRSNGGEHVLKGGGFAADMKNAICATHGAGPGDGWDIGLRVVKDPD